MITRDEIPDKVGKAAMDAVLNGVHDPKEVVAAAINAWPGMDARPTFGPSRIILPLTQEVSDE